MAEHYCNEHGTKFYENHKGDKTWWSHKIQGMSGYCNEKKTEAETDVKPEYTAEKPAFRSPVNRSIAISYAKDLCAAGKIELKELTTYGDKFLQYIEKE